MKKRFAIAICSALVLSAPAATLHAQQGSASNLRFYDFVLNGSDRYTTAIETKVVKGAPYSAEIINESVQALADGNRIVHRTTSRVYRDSMGRVRREEDRATGGPAITITDPVSNRSLTLDPVNKTVRETIGAPWVGEFFGSLAGPRFYNGTLSLSPSLGLFLKDPKSMIAERELRSNPGQMRFSPRIEGSDYSEEHLPARTIEGVAATGIRRTTTIPKGLIGNEQPIKVVSEEWTSADLQVLVLTDFNDPRTGRVTYKLQNIVRAEPDASLFRAPADYKVVRGLRGRSRD